MLTRISILLLISLPLLASEGETDIIQRVFNFVIFAYILYVLIFDKLVAFLKDRTNGIEAKIKADEEKIESLKTEKDNSEKALIKADELSKQIVSDAENISISLVENIEKSTTLRVAALEKSYSQRAEIDNKKAMVEVVQEVLNETIFPSAIDGLSQNTIIDLINKKVA